MSNETNLQTSGQLNAKKSMNKKKRKKIIKTVIVLLIVLAVLLFALNKFGIIGKNESVRPTALTTYTVGTRSITEVLTSSGTIAPNDQYTINALVGGEIIADYFEEGDTVVEDQLLFEIDSDNLNSSVTRAENALKNANKALNDALENLEKLNVESEVTGIVKKLHVEVGDEVNTGTLIADVVDNETMCIDIPFMEVDCSSISVGDIATITFDTYEESIGTVTEISPVTQVNSLGVSVRNVTINVKNTGSITTSTKAYARIGDAYCTSNAAFYHNDEGQIFSKASGKVTKIYYNEGSRIYDGNVIIRLESDDLEEQIDKLRDSVTEAEESLEDAYDAFDNYNIEAPITGKVISKSHKAGDTLSGGQSGSGTLAVIYDMSALKFTMNIDELDIDKLDKGQDVIVTCDSRAGEEYHGYISNISIQGSTTSGTTVYPVEVTIENVEDINKRNIDTDGTVNKIYKTGMTSTERNYTLTSVENTVDGTVYIYTDEIKITRKTDGSLYDGDKQLKQYLGGTFTQGSNFYSFTSDFKSLVLETQNDKKMLRPGMNIDAEIIIEKRENVIAVPLAAVGRGNVVKVIKNTNETSETDDKVATENTHGFSTENIPQRTPEDTGKLPTNEEMNFEKSNMGENSGDLPTNKMPGAIQGYGTADINSEYEEVRVTVGISDNDYVEITSGLSIGDIVIVDTSNLANGTQNMQFGMMGGMGGMGAMNGGAMMGGNRMPMSNMGGAPMGR